MCRPGCASDAVTDLFRITCRSASSLNDHFCLEPRSAVPSTWNVPGTRRSVGKATRSGSAGRSSRKSFARGIPHVRRVDALDGGELRQRVDYLRLFGPAARGRERPSPFRCDRYAWLRTHIATERRRATAWCAGRGSTIGRSRPLSTLNPSPRRSVTRAPAQSFRDRLGCRGGRTQPTHYTSAGREPKAVDHHFAVLRVG